VHMASDSKLHAVFRSVTVAKIMSASSALHCPDLLTNATSNESTRSWGVTRNVDFVSETDRHFMNFVALMTSSCSAKFYTARNTFSITYYFLHPRLPHSHTTSEVDGTDSCFRNTLDILWTLILSHACYIRTFSDPIP